MKTKVTFNKALLMTKQEIEAFNALPDNMPETKLTAKQTEFVNGLYYKYITKQIDNKAWGMPLYKIEGSEKWPSGPRMKEIQSKRIVLNALEAINGRAKMKKSDMASYFLSFMSSRKSWQVILKECFTVKYVG